MPRLDREPVETGDDAAGKVDHGRRPHGLSHSVDELLRCLLSAAGAGVLYERVFIAAKSPAATRLAAPDLASPSPYSAMGLMKQADKQHKRRGRSEAG